jgi:hypothetical protein
MRYLNKKYPNASMLSLITQKDKSGNEKLLFIYLKAIPDYYDNDNVRWLDEVGENGKANYIWEKLAIKQWVVIGKDEKIIELFNLILHSKQIIIGRKIINFDIPQYTLFVNCTDGDEYISKTRYDSLKIVDASFIPQEFYQKENLQFLSGYKTGSSEIKPVSPLGFYEDNFIYNNLKKDICGIKEYRTAYLTFHGVKESSKKGIGSTEMEGFYQQNFDKKENYAVIMKNKNGEKIGESTIDTNTGFFHINLTESVKNGRIEVLLNNKEEKHVDFVLIQDIKFDIQIANKTFIDVYGRNFMISSKQQKMPGNIQNFTWQESVYSNNNEAYVKLSDKFKLVLDYLGPKILVADPYFMGNIKIDETTNSISLLDDQKALVNALMHSYVEKGIEKICILGHWQTAKSQAEKSEERGKSELYFQNYETFFKNFISHNNLEISVLFINAKEKFHNRYWFSINENDILEKCVIITNSIGNIKEVDIMSVTDENQLKQIVRRYIGIYKNAESKLSI